MMMRSWIVVDLYRDSRGVLLPCGLFLRVLELQGVENLGLLMRAKIM